MPLILFSGIPASGKTKRAKELCDYFAEHHPTMPVIHISDESLHLKRNEAYKDARSEKAARATLKASVERQLTRNVIVIADSLNYIKGFRYELYCISRGAATTHCVVHCDTPVEKAREFNGMREDGYTPEILDDLASRFETPNDRQRWDRPLFVVYPDDNLDCEEIARSALEGAQLAPNLCTIQPRIVSGDMLHAVDRISMEITQAILAHQKSGVSSEFIKFANCPDKLPVTGNYTAPELHRLRLQFLKVAELSPPSSEKEAGNMFVQYLIGQARAADE